MMHQAIRIVCNAEKLPAVSVPDLMFNSGDVGDKWRADRALLPAFQRDILYFGFRFLPELLTDPEIDLKRHRFVLLVRDPRDALVSQYYSFGRKDGSHRAPAKNADAFHKQRAAQEDLEIDAYVLKSAEQLRGKFRDYRENLNFDLGLLRRYEDVFFDKRTFLAEAFDHLGIAVRPKVLDRAAARIDVRPEKEDQSKHIRKGTPGDHAEKLQPETIRELNDLFREEGRFFGYDL